MFDKRVLTGTRPSDLRIIRAHTHNPSLLVTRFESMLAFSSAGRFCHPRAPDLDGNLELLQVPGISSLPPLYAAAPGRTLWSVWLGRQAYEHNLDAAVRHGRVPAAVGEAARKSLRDWAAADPDRAHFAAGLLAGRPYHVLARGSRALAPTPETALQLTTRLKVELPGLAQVLQASLVVSGGALPDPGSVYASGPFDRPVRLLPFARIMLGANDLVALDQIARTAEADLLKAAMASITLAEPEATIAVALPKASTVIFSVPTGREEHVRRALTANPVTKSFIWAPYHQRK